MRIELISAPFAGHLHPQLEVARLLREQNASLDIQYLSTASARRAVELCGLPFQELLPGCDATIQSIANTQRRVGSNPVQLLRQLRLNLSMMKQLQQELRERWHRQRPDLVIVDFVVPVAGLLAQSMKIPWWTALSAPCAIESFAGPPTYLGGWQPSHSSSGMLRDWLGRAFIRAFKRVTCRLMYRQINPLGLSKVYRSDRTEAIYSPDTILSMGVKDLEFRSRFPNSLVHLGPLTASPPFPHKAPVFKQGRNHVLVTLGTHVRWAKDSARDLIREVARSRTSWEFHFSWGNSSAESATRDENFQEVSYFPYDEYISRYACAIHHAGTGIMYSCLKAAIPSLIWPQDFDQRDHAARLLYYKLGRTLEPHVESIAQNLEELPADTTLRSNLDAMAAQIRAVDSASILLHRLKRVASQ